MELKTKLRAFLLFIQISATLLLAYVLISMLSSIPLEYHSLIGIDLLCMVITCIYSLSILVSKRHSPEAMALFMIIFFDSMHLFCDAGFLVINGRPEFRALNIAINIIFLICPLLITASYWGMIDNLMGVSEKSFSWADHTIKYIAVIGVLLALGNVFSDYYFGVSEGGEYYRGDLYELTIIIPAIMVTMCVGRITRPGLYLVERLILMSYPVLPLIGAFLQHIFIESSFITISIFLSIVLIYTYIYHIRETRIMELENRLALSRLYSLQVQINPHMMYNTLSSIAGMCDIDPAKAQEMIFKLSDYLRDSFTDIDKPAMVTLREELAYLDHYIAIEVMRFPRITIVKDIETDDFLLPRMSLQPLEENAVKHGICKKRRAEGTITIRSFEEKDAWVVSVADDGAGFEGSIPEGTSDEHHGTYNVRTRLYMLCNGTLEITGSPGEGAVSTIRIPQKNGGVVL